LRQADFEAAQRPDVLLAISRTVAKRIAKYYRRRAEVICPPVDHRLFINSEQGKPSTGDFYLVVSRLVPYKRVDLAVQAFNRLGKPLLIVGEGSEAKRLKRLAKSTVSFVGQLTDEELVRYYQSCRAVVFPGEEDFGLVSLEAQAAGKPVVAYGKGGVTETVVAGKTGEFFRKPTVESLVQTVKRASRKTYKPEDCQRQAARFSQEKFKTVFRLFVEEQWQTYRKKS
jgi:glycosyltransferase involved in cell wall biosynthesis